MKRRLSTLQPDYSESDSETEELLVKYKLISQFSSLTLEDEVTVTKATKYHQSFID